MQPILQQKKSSCTFPTSVGKAAALNCLVSSLVTQMMDQSAPPKPADDTKLGGVVNVPDVCGGPSQGSQQAGETDKQEAQKTQGNANPYSWEGTTTCWGQQPGKLWVLVDKLLVRKCVPVAMRINRTLGWKPLPVDQGRWCFFDTLPESDPSEVLCPVLGLQYTRQAHTGVSNVQRGLGLFNLKKKRPKGSLINVYTCFLGGIKTAHSSVQWKGYGQ